MNSPFQLNTTEKNIPYVLFYDAENGLVPSHWHKEVELVYSLKGGTQLAINNVIYTLGEGDIAVIASGDTHFYFRTQNHVRMVVMFAPEVLEEGGTAARRELEKRLKGVARVSTQWSGAHAEEVRAILQRLAALGDTDTLGRELAIRARLYDLMLLLCNEAARDTTHEHTLDSANQTKMLMNLEKVFAYVEENYTQDIDLGDAAAWLGFTPSYFARFFKRYTNSTFLTYLNGFRVAKAQGMLGNDNKSITQIAEETGFNSIKTFNRVFKEVSGVSPTEYKKSIFEA